jgi:FtsZ-binding cell division protein ZapB
MSTTIKVRKETLQRLQHALEELMRGNSEVAVKLASNATWDTKINALLDRFSESTRKAGERR